MLFKIGVTFVIGIGIILFYLVNIERKSLSGNTVNQKYGSFNKVKNKKDYYQSLDDNYHGQKHEKLKSLENSKNQYKFSDDDVRDDKIVLKKELFPVYER